MPAQHPSHSVAPLIQDPTRLAALVAYSVLDTPPEEGFDDIVQLATQLCQVPVALVSLVAADRQWFKARIGFPPCETDLNSSVCSHVLGEPDLLIIPDLTQDPRTRANPLVRGEPHIRFYAGAPLRTYEGQVLGSLCVIDNEARPHGLTEAQANGLRALARQVMSQLDLRRTLANRDALLAAQQMEIRARDALQVTQAAIIEAEGDIETILDALVKGAMQAVAAAEGGVIELIDGDVLEYRAVRGSLLPHRGLRVPMKGSLAGSCARTNTPIIVPDTLSDPRVKKDLIARLNLRSAVLAPVMRGDQVLGVLKVQSGKPGAFTERDLQQVRLFAGTASAGLTAVREAEAQRSVKESEARYQAIFESVVDYAIIVMSLDGRVTNWNAGATRILGWSPEDICGKPADVFFTSEDRAAGIPDQEMHSALTVGRGTDERWHLRKNGERFFANGEMMALRNAANDAIGFIKILRDRTEEHRNIEALREAGVRLARAQEAGGVGLFSIGIADGILRPTPEFCRLYGLPERDAYPSTAFEQLVIKDDAHLVSTARTRRNGEAPRDVEYRIRRPDTGVVRWIARKGEIEQDEAGRPLRFSGVARDITEQRDMQEALVESERHWRGLFEQLKEGFILGRVIRDATGGITDWRYEEVNRAWGELVGVPSHQAFGRTIRELFPGIEDAWVQEFAQVVETGQSVTFTRQVSTLERWYEGRAQKLTDESFVVLFLEVTERVLAEQGRRADERRTAALLELGDGLRDLTRIPDMTRAAAEIVGRVLGVSRAGFGRLDLAGDTATLEPDWTAEGQAIIAGAHRFSDYGNLRQGLLDGHPIVIDDVQQDPRTAPDTRSLTGLDIASLVNMPVRERGRTVALFFVHDRQPRIWQPAEIAFLRTVADRVEVAVSRVRAEDQQRVLNQELSHRMKNMLAMVQSIATQTMRGAADMDSARNVLAGRLIALSKSHDLLLGGEIGSTGLAALVGNALEAHRDNPDRFVIEGPPVVVGSKAALSLSLILHELGTNASKYGALSTESGRVTISWQILPEPGEPTVTLCWSEAGGPPVAAPSRTGFGTRLIGRGLAGSFGGNVDLTYPPTGVVCTVTAPLSGLQADENLPSAA